MSDTWVGLTDDDRQKALLSMPDYLDGFLKHWGWLNFAKAIEQICREKNERRLSEAQEKIERVEKENLLLTHKVITCGVAASHPDATLTERGVYVEKWNSPQADDVRVLRKRAQAAESRCAELREALWVCAEHNELHFGANHNTVIQARAALTKEAKHG